LKKNTLKIETIQRGLKTSRIGRRIILLDTAASTNDTAWSYAHKPDSDGVCVLAEYQTAGRGRRGRQWHSPPGQSILCSVLIGDFTPTPALLTLAAPLAVTDAIFTCCGLHTVIKWPNDILLDSKKIAGILLESRKSGRRTMSVIGIGINVCQTKTFFKNLPLEAPAVSLAMKLRRKPSRNKLLRCLFERLEYWMDMASENPEKLTNHWKRHNRQIGARIELESDGKQYCGTCVGLSPDEGLIVHLDRGPVKIFSASQTTLRKPTMPQVER
jgi:BirA family transcriptional regulator, biotin operon repressor / biotin---[acetyl-CoA-carboxylase] ligase